MKKIIGVVLAGGAGERFWPIIKDKTLLPFLGRPLIRYTLEALQEAGIREIVVVANPKNRDAITRIKLAATKIKVVVQEKPLGMGHALSKAEAHIRKKPIIVSNAADIVDNKLLPAIVKKARRGDCEVIIPGLEKEEYFPGGYLKLKGGRVSEIVEKPKPGTQPSNLVNIVIHYFRNADDVLEKIKKLKTGKDDAYESAVSEVLKDKKASFIRYKGLFGFVKYPWDMLTMTQLFLREKMCPRISKTAEIHLSATVEGPVIIEEGVRVLEHAVIKGPAFVGAGSLVGTNALVLQSMISKDCVLGFASEVTRSYLGEGCWLHKNYIGDSVLEGYNSFGAGAVTANFRFDEGSIHSLVKGERLNSKRTKFGAILGRGARVGVNASLMPGVKIGSAAFIGPGVVQYTDVKSDELVLVDSSTVSKVKPKKAKDQ